LGAYRIILADDHIMFRQGIKWILKEFKGVEVVGEANDGFELLELLKHVSTDMVILDISMPKIRGIEVTREIKMTYPGVKVLILTMHKSPEYLYHAISAGAEGYLIKEDADTVLLDAIKKMKEGRDYISPLLSEMLNNELIQIFRGKRQFPLEGLTTREREVIKLIADGKSSQEIADLFCISVRTVQHHRANIMRKLKAGKTADLVRYAIRKGYTSVDT
jgi:DNA-binding NarL/FixJ family response regulator